MCNRFSSKIHDAIGALEYENPPSVKTLSKRAKSKVQPEDEAGILSSTRKGQKKQHARRYQCEVIGKAKFQRASIFFFDSCIDKSIANSEKTDNIHYCTTPASKFCFRESTSTFLRHTLLLPKCRAQVKSTSRPPARVAQCATLLLRVESKATYVNTCSVLIGSCTSRLVSADGPK